MDTPRAWRAAAYQSRCYVGCVGGICVLCEVLLLKVCPHVNK